MPILENISYYNQIADSYDAILAKDRSNEEVRKRTAAIFSQAVPSGIVLDFGGGTGSDLDWLTHQQYTIIFCEPAASMRQKAIDLNNNNLQNPGIIFLSDCNADFRNWRLKLPFSQKADAVLLNFAVMNCIPDIGYLFENLSLVTKEGAHFFALILNKGLKKTRRADLWEAIRSLFAGKPGSYATYYKGKRQKVFIHSVKTIKKKSAKYFSFKEITTMPGPEFSLIHLIRK